MGNYNPRQNTRMRWRDERELEKFVFISGNFNFQNEEGYEKASTTYPYNKIISVIKKNNNKGTKQPIILYDTTGSDVFVGVVKGIYITCYYLSEITTPALFELQYNEEEDILYCNITLDSMITEDNLKTIFGNQSLIGTGNIDLYRHQLTLTFLKPETETNTRIQFEVYSSNKLVVDSLQDLTNLLKPNNNSSFIGFSLDESNQLYLIVYEDSIWKVSEITPPPYSYKPVLSVKDVVTTI